MTTAIETGVRNTLLEGGQALVLKALEEKNPEAALEILRELIDISSGKPLDRVALIQAAMHTRSLVPTISDPKNREKILNFTDDVSLLASSMLEKPPVLE